MTSKGFTIRQTRGDRVFLAVNYLVLCIVFVLVAYPVLFILFASVSDAKFVNSGALLLWPKGFHISGYRYVLREQRIWIGYANTIFYAAAGTVLGLAASLLAGFSLSTPTLPGRKIFMALMVFTMYFSGGLIPSYLVVKGLHLLDSRAIIVLLGSVSVYNIILIRTFFLNTIPKELQEAASIDGCGYGRFFFQIVLPLSKAIIAVIALYLVVGYWNSYFTALIYLQDSSKKPLQLFLREILLVSTQSMQQQTENAEAMAEYQRLLEVIKYAVIVVSTLPVMCIYPFLQKYFVQGVMIGSLKG
ncbi:MAG: carbohydrate ABC transporter permease [Candidatus Merdivicinus sp.]|jgi:putative aldouronate transport system permease protein